MNSVPSIVHRRADSLSRARPIWRRETFRYQVLTPLTSDRVWTESAELEIAVYPQKDLAGYEFQFFAKEGDYWPEASGDELQPTYQPNGP
jgi:hypothetical protein